MAWQSREREYLQYLCAGQGIEIETLGVKRDNYTLQEYKKAMEITNEHNINGIAVPVKNFFGNGEYVKIKKNDWGHVIEAYKWAKSKEKLLEQYEETIIAKDNKNQPVTNI